jgi:phospholipid/cholesterol/gamma-HCH transport system substrate-binding protein
MARNQGRRTPTRNQLALRGLIALLVIAVFVELVRLHSSGVIGGPPVVTAQLRNAGGALVKGSDVKLHGVIVGRVKDIQPGRDGSVDVDIDMVADQLPQVPADVVARILPATVFGTTYIDLRPADEPQQRPGAVADEAGSATVVKASGSSTAHGSLKDGAVIPADTTQPTLELQDALDDIDGLVKALDPAELSTAIGAAAVALDGRGKAIGDTAVALDAYLRTFNPKVQMLRSDLDKLSAFLQVVKEIAPDLLDATDDALVPLSTLVAHKDDLTALLTGGKSLADTSQAVLAKNSVKLTRFINDAYGVVDALYDNRKAGITDSIAVNRRIAGIVRAASERGYLKVGATLQLNAPPYYGAGDRPSYGGGR